MPAGAHLVPIGRPSGDKSGGGGGDTCAFPPAERRPLVSISGRAEQHFCAPQPGPVEPSLGRPSARRERESLPSCCPSRRRRRRPTSWPGAGATCRSSGLAPWRPAAAIAAVAQLGAGLCAIVFGGQTARKLSVRFRLLGRRRGASLSGRRGEERSRGGGGRAGDLAARSAPQRSARLRLDLAQLWGTDCKHWAELGV